MTDADGWERRVVEHRADALRTTRQTLRKLSTLMDPEEAEGAALEALVVAARAWKAELGPFGPYLHLRVTGAVKDEARRWDPLSRAHRTELTQAAVDAELRGEAVPDWRGTRAPTSLDVPTAEGGSLADVLEAPALVDLEESEVAWRREAARVGLAALDARARVVLASLMAGHTAAALAQVFGVTESRVSQLRHAVADKLREAR